MSSLLATTIRDVTRLEHAFGWTLLHFLWQGNLIATTFAATLALTRRETAAYRHTIACCALGAMILLLLATLVELLSPWQTHAEHVFTRAAAAPAVVLPPSLAASFMTRLIPAVDSHLWMIELVWLAGFLWALVRLAPAVLAIQKAVRRATRLESAEANSALARIASRSNASGFRVLTSEAITTPIVVGIFRPAILLPPSFFASVSPSEAEAVLAHECAHILRRDPLVNALQLLIEALLFFHPAVWWVSGRIRREREYCCDDAAVSLCGSSLLYAKALATLEERRAILQPQLFPGIATGDLSMRIHRLFAQRKAIASTSTRAAVTVSAVITTACLIFLSNTAVVRVQAAVPLAQAVASASSSDKDKAPDLDCSYYDASSTVYEADCEVTSQPEGPFYCAKRADSTQKQRQVACGWKVKRYLDWTAAQHSHDMTK